MAVGKDYLEYVVEQLERVSRVTTRRMFGGVGIYSDALFFALIDDDTLYFKVDDTNRPDFEAQGMAPFRPFEGSPAMQYYEVPANVLEDRAALEAWVAKAIAVARRATAARRKKAKRKTAAAAATTTTMTTMKKKKTQTTRTAKATKANPKGRSR